MWWAMSFHTAFDFVPLDGRRSNEKPRKKGITMVSDYQMGLAGLADLIEFLGIISIFLRLLPVHQGYLVIIF